MSDSGFDGLITRAEPAPIPEGPRTVADVLARGVAEHPTRELVVGRSRSCSYAAFDDLANRAARVLADRGIGRGDRVAASLASDVDVVAFFHGALRLGAVWVGINRNLADREKAFILDDAGVRFFLGDREMNAQVESLRAKGELAQLESVLLCEREDPGCEWSRAIEAARAERPDVVLAPNDPAAIAYTSGTTGFPKGVVHSHHNLVLPGAGQKEAFGLGPSSRRSYAFPLTILNIQAQMSVLVAQHGGSCVLMDRVDARGIAEWIHRERITMFTAAPAQLHGLTHDTGIEAEWLASVERVYSGGAYSPPEILEGFARRFGIEVGLTYGLTEAPTAVTMDRSGGERVAGASGKALPHCEISIRDDDDRELPVGEVGEVCVGPKRDGPWAGVWTPMLGYWKQREASESALRDGRLHTGDLGRLDRHGYLYIVDRKNLMIVRGGANVYPAEVERILHTDDRVVACAVVGAPDERLGERVVAWVELAEGVKASDALSEELRERCAASLARFKVPERIAFVSTLPRNAMGKVQRAELPTMDLH